MRALAGGETVSACGSPTPRATPPTTSVTSTRRAAPPSSAMSPPCLSRRRTCRPPDAAARHRHRDLARLDRHRRRLAAGAARPHPLRRDRRPRRHLATVRKRLREEAQLARNLAEGEYEKRHRALVATRADTEEAAEELIQCVPPQYQWRGLDRYWRKRELSARAAPRTRVPGGKGPSRSCGCPSGAGSLEPPSAAAL